MESSPEFLPLKYKPKRVPGGMSNYTDAKFKIAEAKQRNKNDVNLMLEYSLLVNDESVYQLSTCQNKGKGSNLNYS